MAAAPAYAQLPGDCTELGIAITEHSCFHSVFGPFQTVMATAGTGFSDDTPNIDPVHTEYRIGLTGEYSVVSYTPKRSGAWAVLLGKDVPFEVLGGQGLPVPATFNESGTTGCEALPLLHVYELTQGTKYRFIFGPTAERTVVAVVEYIDDFLTQNGRDDDGDGFGSKVEVIETPCEPPAGFAPNTRDCNDADPLVHPGAAEVCDDGVDQNCNGSEGDSGLPCRIGTGACEATGKSECAAGVAMCLAVPLEPRDETCNGKDDDCNGQIDDGDSLCINPDRPTCVRNGMAAACGCRLDLDCGEVTSGRTCNQETGSCEDGCSPLPGRNNCGAGEVCNPETARCESESGVAGAGGVGGVESAGAGGSDASVSGSGGGSGSAPLSSGAAPSEGGESGAPANPVGGSKKDGGCGCRVAGQQHSRGATRVLCGLALAICYLRRRQRVRGYLASAAVAASSLVACGGRTQDVGDRTSDKGDAAAMATSGSSSGGASSGGASSGGSGSSGATVGGASEGGAAQTPPECIPVLGEQLVAHACSHTNNGPFIDVVAGGEVDPPDVSELHHTYELQIVGSEARLHYRAQRNGNHAFLTNMPVKLELWRDGQKLGARPSFAVESCNTISAATVCDLEREAEYEIVLLDSPDSLDFFVEHLPAFGSEAWLEPCDDEVE